ncbi:hypothetical protein PGT21_017896 [Puccinia graminis f. sp. tritici]|uniref:Uncharacterized protein n=1 Tax=Puccinia graminis f. sp. tritici TaxID=56615 RepID=A0A5B0QNW5_PUCGR|nr:hypothetical protein PGT21_017896 [Puccinia graminis f. sp. tritici]
MTAHNRRQIQGTQVIADPRQPNPNCAVGLSRRNKNYRPVVYGQIGVAAARSVTRTFQFRLHPHATSPEATAHRMQRQRIPLEAHSSLRRSSLTLYQPINPPGYLATSSRFCQTLTHQSGTFQPVSITPGAPGSTSQPATAAAPTMQSGTYQPVSFQASSGSATYTPVTFQPGTQPSVTTNPDNHLPSMFIPSPSSAAVEESGRLLLPQTRTKLNVRPL